MRSDFNSDVLGSMVRTNEENSILRAAFLLSAFGVMVSTRLPPCLLTVRSDYYTINIELDQLYCIDMEDLNMGGSWDSDLFFLVTFDLYDYKNGIDYNEKK